MLVSLKENLFLYNCFIISESDVGQPEGGLSQGSGSLRLFNVGKYSNLTMIDDSDSPLSDSSEPPAKKSRGTVNILNVRVVSVLDKCKISSRDAVHLIIAIADALGHKVDTLIVNASSIHRYREKIREAKAAHIKEVFKNMEFDSLVVHWDGKMLYNMVKHEVLDRLPILVSNNEIEKLIGIPELSNGTGKSQAEAVCEVLEDWGLSDRVKALSCDTTPSNFGIKKGAAYLVEKSLERDILFLPCRHHMFELVIKSVFEEFMPKSTGPNVALFKNFQKIWPEIDQTKYKTGLLNNKVNRILSSRAEEVNLFIEDIYKSSYLPRGDYRELLELSQIFLGKIPSRGIKFKYPGASSHARFMSKTIYCLKIFIFRDCFELDSEELESLREICIFNIDVYLEVWFTCPFALSAPNNDLKFLKKLKNYKTISPKVSEITLKKFQNHLWYLNPESAALAFFDKTISDGMKKKMVLALVKMDTSNKSKRFMIKISKDKPK